MAAAEHDDVVPRPAATPAWLRQVACVNETAFECELCIDAGHPALPGHFPGHPLVPGVVLLEQVAQALHRWRGQRVLRVLETKFMAPLLPNETAVLRLIDMRTGGTKVRFEIRRGDLLLTRGVIEGADEHE